MSQRGLLVPLDLAASLIITLPLPFWFVEASSTRLVHLGQFGNECPGQGFEIYEVWAVGATLLIISWELSRGVASNAERIPKPQK